MKKSQAPTEEQIRSTEDPGELVRLLSAVGEQLPSSLRERIVALGRTAIPLLLEILADEENLLASKQPSESWAPFHATKLLAELRAVEAIAPLLRLLSLVEPGEDILFDQLLFALPKLGPAVLEPALRAYQQSDDPEYRGSICDVLAKLGLRDGRIYSMLIQQLEREPVLAADNLAHYGDSRALGPLSRAFNRIEIEDEDDDRLLSNDALIEIEAAIEDLGGVLSPTQELKFERVMAIRARSRARFGQPHEVRRKLGRNDPCWCGSGKKYKKCHLEVDQRDEATRNEPE